MFNNFLNLIFPKKCLNCNFNEKWLCDACKLKLFYSIEDRKCKICLDNFKPYHFCLKDEQYFFSLLDYKNEITSKLIGGFKYLYLTDLVNEIFFDLIQEFWDRHNNYFNDSFIIVPIPIHNKKQLKRGFNQSQLIAEKLALVSGLKLADDLLIRIINNKSQAGSGDIIQRQKNTKGIFKINYRQLSSNFNKNILLIDDVYTTGSTINEAKMVLNSVGFKQIATLVLAMN